MHTSKDVRLYAAVLGIVAIAAVLAIMLVAPPPEFLMLRRGTPATSMQVTSLRKRMVRISL